MLQDAFHQVYSKFKLHFYKKVFEKLGDREASLTTVETFCMEIIHSLGSPTVNEFAQFAQMSSPNAAYKVNSLIQKGYLVKEQSTHDRREFHIMPSQKYYDYYNVSFNYVNEVINRMEERFSTEDVAKLQEMLLIMSKELMPEMPKELNINKK